MPICSILCKCLYIFVSSEILVDTSVRRWYAEDCDRIAILKPLKSLGDMLLKSIVCTSVRDRFPETDQHDNQIEIGDINDFVPSEQRIRDWETATGTPWDLFKAATVMLTRTVECPKCFAPNATREFM